MALKQGKYEYLHLLSGQDLPLKDQDYIHGFFNSLKKGIWCYWFQKLLPN